MEIETVTISIERYEKLLKAYEKLHTLYAAGINNCEGYSLALQDEKLNKLDEEDEE